MEACMVPSRRSLIAGLVGASLSIWPRSARSQTFAARQYHPQPVGSHLHIYLTKLWEAVRKETRGRLDVTVYPQNNGAIIADPDVLKQLQSGGLEFFVLNGNILSEAHPSADIQGIPFAFTSSEQVTSLTDGKLGDLMRDGLSAAGVYHGKRLQAHYLRIEADPHSRRSRRLPHAHARRQIVCRVLQGTRRGTSD